MIKMAKEEKLLIPLEKYLQAGVHIGTKYKTKHMSPFVYKTNPDGLAIMDIQQIDKRLAIAGRFLSKYSPKEIVVVGRRENAWRPIKAFAKVTGAHEFAGRYKAGVITNPLLDDYIEPKVMVVVDPWLDKNAIHDAMLRCIPVVSLVDTNNTTNKIDLAVPCNNRGDKALGVVFWVLANQYLKERGEIKKDLDIPVEKFYEE